MNGEEQEYSSENFRNSQPRSTSTIANRLHRCCWCRSFISRVRSGYRLKATSQARRIIAQIAVVPPCPSNIKKILHPSAIYPPPLPHRILPCRFGSRPLLAPAAEVVFIFAAAETRSCEQRDQSASTYDRYCYREVE